MKLSKTIPDSDKKLFKAIKIVFYKKMVKKNILLLGFLFVLSIGMVSAVISFNAPTPVDGFITDSDLIVGLTSDNVSIPGDFLGINVVVQCIDNPAEGMTNKSKSLSANLTIPIAGFSDGKCSYYGQEFNKSQAVITKTATQTIIFDRNLPVTTDNAPTTNQTDKVTVTLTCTDTGAGCNVTKYCINTTGIGCTPDTEGNSVALTSVGSFYISYFSSDKAGHIETVKNSTEIIIVSIPVPQQPSGGSSSSTCYTEWTCTEFGECINGIQLRTCSYPLNYCTPEESKPSETQTCIMPTTPQPPAANQPLEQTEIQQTQQQNQQSAGLTGAAIGALRTPKGILILVIVVVAGVVIAYFLVRKRKVKGNVKDKVKWKSKNS